MAERPRRQERSKQYRSPSYREWVRRIAANVQWLRDARGWTQEQAAEACGMDVRHLQSVEAADVNLTLTTLARLSDGFRIDPVQLVAPAEQPRKRSPGRPGRKR